MDQLADVLGKAIFLVLGASLGPAATHVISRRLRRRDLTPEALVDIVQALSGCEPVWSRIARIDQDWPKDLRDFRSTDDYSSSWDVPRFTVAIDVFLDLMPGAKASSMRMLVDRRKYLDSASEEHRAAYFWLLDSKDVDSTENSAGTRERLAALRVCRGRVYEALLTTLRRGYHLAVDLCDEMSAPDATLCREGLPTSRELRLRAAYYRLENLTVAFDRKPDTYQPFRWTGVPTRYRDDQVRLSVQQPFQATPLLVPPDCAVVLQSAPAVATLWHPPSAATISVELCPICSLSGQIRTQKAVGRLLRNA